MYGPSALAGTGTSYLFSSTYTLREEYPSMTMFERTQWN